MAKTFAVFCFAAVSISVQAGDANLLTNPAMAQVDEAGQPVGFELEGGAKWRKSVGDPSQDMTGSGMVLPGSSGGAVSQTVTIDARHGRAFAFRFRGLPQDGFAVGPNGLGMKVEFFGEGGKTRYDSKRKELYPVVEKQRRDLAANGNGRTGGAATWHDYLLTFYVPFPQVDRVKLTVVCTGSGKTVVAASTPAQGSRRGMKRVDTAGSDFLLTDFSLTRLPEPAPVAQTTATPAKPSDETKRIPLGGRWFYAAKPDESQPPALFDHKNAERLLYQEGTQFLAPFAGNMSATLRAGNLDAKGEAVAVDRPLLDNVTVRFDANSMIVHTRGIPNHPTGRFPEEGRGNPNSIQEQDRTFHIPLVPKEDPKHVALPSDGRNNNALNMGAIGVAVNGVVFFNPFDAGDMDASSIMDRCCGHPNQEGEYHYHKYPVCLNSMWSDEGNAHSPLLGWAFDGYPIYGPYEAKDKMAKDVTGASALNAFNMHQDTQRGWHYHVTPGKFPYMIGGYWGTVDSRNVRRMGPPGGGRGPGPGGPGFGGPGGGRGPRPGVGPPPPLER